MNRWGVSTSHYLILPLKLLQPEDWWLWTIFGQLLDFVQDRLEQKECDEYEGPLSRMILSAWWRHIINKEGETGVSVPVKMWRNWAASEKKAQGFFLRKSGARCGAACPAGRFMMLNIISSDTPGCRTCSGLPAPDSAFNACCLLQIYSHDTLRTFKTLCLIHLNLPN